MEFISSKDQRIFIVSGDPTVQWPVRRVVDKSYRFIRYDDKFLYHTEIIIAGTIYLNANANGFKEELMPGIQDQWIEPTWFTIWSEGGKKSKVLYYKCWATTVWDGARGVWVIEFSAHDCADEIKNGGN